MVAKKNTNVKEPRALLVVNNGRIAQETYETASNDARRRAKLLRDKGYKVVVSSMGNQTTQWGRVKLSMVTVFPGKHRDTTGLPRVNRI